MRSFLIPFVALSLGSIAPAGAAVTFKKVAKPKTTVYLGTGQDRGWSGPVQGAQAGGTLEVHDFRSEGAMGLPVDSIAGIEMGAAVDGVAKPYRALKGAMIPGVGYRPSGVAKLRIPKTAKDTAEVWFRVKTADGATHWDSNLGRNFKIDVIPAPSATIDFQPGWVTNKMGTLKAGGAFKLRYDMARMMPTMGDQIDASQTFALQALVSFDGKFPQSINMTGWTGPEELSVYEPNIKIPNGAKKASIWFFGRGRSGAHGWDSNRGANYDFSIEP